MEKAENRRKIEDCLASNPDGIEEAEIAEKTGVHLVDVLSILYDMEDKHQAKSVE